MLHRVRPKLQAGRLFSTWLNKFATLDPSTLSKAKPGKVWNLVGGEWHSAKKSTMLVDPMNGDPFCEVPDAQEQAELDLYIKSLKKCPKSGLHNPFKNPDRYLLYGQVMRRTAEALHDPEVFNFFSKLIQRFVPKSKGQADGELVITRNFIENFAGDNIRYLAQAFQVPGDHTGQLTAGYRWPYGPVAVIAPFNFPLEIPTLQTLGALFMGNKVLLKPDTLAAPPMQQLVRLLHACGMPPEDLDLVHCSGPTMQKLLESSSVRCTQFTGSSRTAERLTAALKGKVKLEDAGFDWKITGPDVSEIDYVAYMIDHDAYAFGGQKCSAQSVLFVHSNWVKAGLIQKIEAQTAKRSLKDLTIVPILTWDNERLKQHISRLMELEGSEILFGGAPLQGHSIPPQYGSFQPTAVKVPLSHWKNKEKRKLLTTEVFGPFQVVTEWGNKPEDLQTVISALESMEHHLTAAIVSNDVLFQNKILGNTVNGTQYVGIRARTTGAPQNHWFGPAGDPRGAGIGSREAVIHTWSCHREVVSDEGPVPENWKAPAPV